MEMRPSIGMSVCSRFFNITWGLSSFPAPPIHTGQMWLAPTTRSWLGIYTQPLNSHGCAGSFPVEPAILIL